MQYFALWLAVALLQSSAGSTFATFQTPAQRDDTLQPTTPGGLGRSQHSAGSQELDYAGVLSTLLLTSAQRHHEASKTCVSPWKVLVRHQISGSWPVLHDTPNEK